MADEQSTLNAVKSDLAGRMPGLLTVTDTFIPCSAPLELTKNLKGTVKAEISRWIRQSIFFRFSNIQRPLDLESKPACSLLTLSEFEIVCCTLETLEEHPVLADVLGLASNSNEILLLNAIADTLNTHFDIFRAIGAIDDLFHRLLSNTAGCLSRMPSDTGLLMSLIDLGERLPNARGAVRQLRKEISLCRSKPPLTAYSPVSDHVAEVLKSTEATFVEEMETVWISRHCHAFSRPSQGDWKELVQLMANQQSAFAISSLICVLSIQRLLTLCCWTGWKVPCA